MEDDTKAAFLAIGDKGNHLRFLAYGSILAHHLFRDSSSDYREKQSFWSQHKELLAVQYDMDKALAVAQVYSRSDNTIICAYAKETMEILGRLHGY